MADSVLFPLSGDRVVDANGNTYAAATLEFCAAATSDPLTVYVDKDLATPHPASIATTSGGQVPDIWLGIADYKVTIKDSTGAIIPGYPRDNRKGALNTGGFSTTYARPTEPAISVTSIAYTLLAANLGKVHDCNPAGGDITLSLLAPATAGDGATVTIRHVGASGNVTINDANVNMTLTRRGQAVTVTCNGASWRVKAEARKLFLDGNPVINIADRLTAPPTSPAPGARYIINGTPAGAWSGFANKDVVEYHAALGWIQLPPELGWRAYVVDEALDLRYNGSAWVELSNITAPTTSTRKSYIVRNKQANGTAGGTATSGSWATCPLNFADTSIAAITGASLASDKITLPVGKYKITATQSFYSTYTTTLRLYNVTDAAEVERSETAQFGVTAVGPTAVPVGGQLTVVTEFEVTSGTKELRLEYYCSNTQATNGLGLIQADTSDEYHATVVVEDLVSLQGPQGTQGPTGSSGLDAAYYYLWDTGTSGDPGTGKIGVNHGTLSSVTQVRISETTASGTNIAAVIATFDDSTSADKARLRFQKEGAENNFGVYTITAAGTDHGTYWTFPVSHVASNGSISAGNDTAVIVIEKGDQGDPGVTVPDITGLATLAPQDIVAGDLSHVHDSSAGALKKTDIYTFVQRGHRHVEEYFTAYGGADDGSADCAAAFNAAIADCAANGYRLRTRPGTYRCNSSITLASNLHWELDGYQAHIRRDYASSDASTFLLRSHANFNTGSPLSNVTVTGGRWGATDGIAYPGGAMFLWLNDSRFSDFWITKFGDEYARFGAQAFNWGGTRFIVSRAHITGPQAPAADIGTLYPANTPWGGSGGMRFFGGADCHALHCYVESGDDGLQFVPIISSTTANHANLDIIGCTYFGCRARSYGGRAALIAYGGVLPTATFTYVTGTSGDPGSGNVRGNNATLASVTEIAVSETTGGTPTDYTSALATWGAGTIIRIQRTGSNLLVVRLTGTGTDAGAYRTFPCTVVHTLGTPAGGTSSLSYTSLTGKISQALHIACTLESANSKGIGYMIQNEHTTGVVEDSGCIATRLTMFDQTVSANLAPLSVLQTAGSGGVIRPRVDLTVHNPYNKLADITAEEAYGIKEPDIAVHQADRTDLATIIGLIDVENVSGGRIRGTVKANATETAIRVGSSSKTVRNTTLGPFRIEHAANTGSNINIINLQTTQDITVEDVVLYPDSGDATTRVFCSASSTGALFRRLDASRLGISHATRLNNVGIATRFVDCVGVDEDDPFITLTDAASIAWDMSRGRNFIVTLGGNRALANPTDERVGSTGKLIVKQDATGGRTLSFGTQYATNSPPNAAASSVTVYDYTVEATSVVHLNQIRAYSTATTSAEGIVELATSAEAITGTDTTRAVTPSAMTAAIDARVATLDVSVHKGVIDCSANPNYPAADRGHTYRVSVAGKIGGASGPNVEAGDMLMCSTDSTAAGDHATVGASWGIVQANLDGAVIGPASAVDNELALYNSTTGKLIKRANMTGLVKAASGVASAATKGTDYDDYGYTELVASTSLTGASVEAAIAGGYTELLILITAASHDSGSNQQLRVEFSMDGGSTWPLLINYANNVTAATSINTVVVVSGYARTTSAPKVGFMTTSQVNTTNTVYFRDTTAAAINRARFSASGGNQDGGSFWIGAR